MKVVFLPVSPLSAAVLRYKFGPAEPLKIGVDSPAYASLFTIRPVHDNIKKISKVCTAVVRVYVRDDMVRKVDRLGHQMGYNLHKLHVSELMVFLMGRYMLKEDVKESVLIYYRMVGIQEDDYSLETALRKWTRYKNRYYKVRASSLRFSREEVPGRLDPFSDRLPWPRARVLRFMDEVIIEFFPLFVQGSSFKLYKGLVLQMDTYLMRNFGRVSLSDYVDATGISARVVQDRIARFKRFLDLYPDVARFIDQRVNLEAMAEN